MVSEGKSQREVASYLRIPRPTIQAIIYRYNATGSTTPGVRGHGRRTVWSVELQARLHTLINDNRTTTIKEIKMGLDVDVSLTTVWRWLKKEGYSYKMTRPIFERRNDTDIKTQRVEFIRWYTSNTPIFRYRNIIFIDESPFNLHMFRSHSWAPRGVTPNPIIRPRGRNVTMILAINSLNIIHCEAVTSSVNGEVFSQFLSEIKRILGRTERWIIVMDNVNFHHSQDLTGDPNFSIHFLPPYSPFLNPCEEVFSYLKSHVRRDTAPRGTDDLIRRMRDAAKGIPNNILSNYYSHCESFFEACLRMDDIPRD